MGKTTSLDHVVSLPTEAAFIAVKKGLTFRVLIISSVIIFTFETLLMLVLDVYLVLPIQAVVLLDGLILIGLLLPIYHIFIVRPMSRQVEMHYRTNQELVKSNEILTRFFSISDLLIAYMDADFNFLRVNQAYAAAGDRQPEALIGKNHFDIFPDPENRAIFESVVRTGKPYFALETPSEHPERGTSFRDWSLLPVKNPSGQVTALILVLNDVTSRKQAQLALVESERRFRAVFDQTFQHSVLLDSEGKALLVNQTAIDFSGLSLEEMIGLPLWELPWWDATSPAYAENTDRLKAAVCQAGAGGVVRGEYRVKSMGGEKAVMDITIKPLVNERGSTVMLIYEARDISEHFRAEEALQRSEAEIKRLYLAEINAHEFAETLRSAVLALSGSLDSETVLKTLLDHLNKVVPYSSAHILLLEDEDHLTVRLAHGEESWPEPDRLVGKTIEIADTEFLKPLLNQGEILSVPDTLLHPLTGFLPTDAFVRSCLGIPLMAGEQVVGICLLEHSCPEFFNHDRVHWATALTGQAAVSIHNAWLFEQVRDGREHLQALSRRLVEVQERERRFIARELHDEAGQALTLLKFGLHHLENDSGDPAAVAAHCQDLKQIANTVLDSLHRLAVGLRPAALDHLGLLAALRQYVETMGSQHELIIQLETVGKIERLPGEMETAIYRIVQESLTNVVRHAHATRVDILLEKHDNQLIVVVEDNGIGFDPQNPKVSQLGVFGMRERAEMLGGKLTIESAHGQGCTILLEVPWQSES
jgi:PAS domain S-box-containing protein